jgi:AcrR family transcriptional regulator
MAKRPRSPRAAPAATRTLTVGGSLKNRELLSERRRELVDAATEVFIERGFDRVSVNDIAERCNWSVGGLYRYIKSKDDILVLVCDEIYGHIGPDLLDGLASEAPPDRLREALTTYWDSIAANRRQVLLMYREYQRLGKEAQRYFQDQERAVATVFRAIIEDGVKRGDFFCEDPEIFAVECVLLGHTSALKHWALGARSLSQVRDSIIEWTLRSLKPASH